ncbi:hypothetical protein F7725_025903 [Dissostichus mawsoni]|uniref:WxxW domain-containing protein n=1 Tax=Dissostichus mawsoni TaxID=36200 RepID=A0A7J5X710_DISMA|nr:hypothetical protein F7725_025903 [Dissostichus mawsoni]
MTCGWSEWINLGKPTSGPNGGDDESIHNIISAGYHICSAPEEVQSSMSEMGQTVTCNKDVGFICNNKQQGPTQHTNYTLNTFHDSNICNTLNSLNHSNNYNTLNYFNTVPTTTPSTTSTTVTTATPSTPSTTVTASTPLSTTTTTPSTTTKTNNTSANHNCTLPWWT